MAMSSCKFKKRNYYVNSFEYTTQNLISKITLILINAKYKCIENNLEVKL